jgi:AN1-type zinc finger protein 5/6
MSTVPLFDLSTLSKAIAAACAPPVSSEHQAQAAQAQSKKSRCAKQGCDVKLPLTALECRCCHRFCSKHRYPEEHACSVDYKALGTKELLKTMSTAVTGEKLQKI